MGGLGLYYGPTPPQLELQRIVESPSGGRVGLMNYLTRNQTASSSRRCSGKQFQKMAVSRLVLHIPTVALRPVCPSAIHLNARTRDRHRRTAALRSLGLAYSGCAALADPFDLRVPIKYILVPVAGNWLRRRSRLITMTRLDTNND